MSHRATLKLEIVPSPETNDHAVRILVDGSDLLALHGQLGLDPDDFFSSPDLAVDTSREARIGRCGCGVVGCSDFSISIARDGEEIVWRVDGRELRFAADAYDAELKRAAADHSWETPERTAARLLRERLPTKALAARGFQLDWASGRVRSGTFTVSLRPANDPYRQILLDVPWRDDIEYVVAAALGALDALE